jgi:hypothetical protein
VLIKRRTHFTTSSCPQTAQSSITAIQFYSHLFSSLTWWPSCKFVELLQGLQNQRLAKLSSGYQQSRLWWWESRQIAETPRKCVNCVIIGAIKTNHWQKWLPVVWSPWDALPDLAYKIHFKNGKSSNTYKRRILNLVSEYISVTSTLVRLGQWSRSHNLASP